MNLKPETPLVAKLQIKRLEDECENLRLWRWRLTIAIELILITVLGACDQLLCNQVKGVRTLQEIKKEHPYKPASFGHSDKKPIQL
ncbi:hypothetical protein G4359_08460 [Dorea longicatena]|uniref:hypothetical protein n=1 Tax=Dorea longicatena TaxID=88431 RepID=UPI00156FDEB5|nr:hypothetical protein [Dorea longicatena]NSC50216.1 hypothetical protein [Dorea longicatena]NSD26267.1 hypothetical protein [Dorea longicatena]NSD41708.1 hypothetical protein [Dorea longicatena]NSD70937.1 hypothetical protein [Dorea longicatena]NSD73784.1 hypothetical protein [Dorea longicatena]